MLITAVIIASSIVLSSAQPSPECITAYNATFSSEDPTCVTAYYLLLTGNATDEQRMMVCNEGQQCNTMLENIITECGDAIESPTRYLQDLLCASGPNGITCFSALSSLFATENNVIETVYSRCYGCTPSCLENLSILSRDYGCCVAEIFQALVQTGSLTNAQASFFTNGLSQVCAMPPFALCNDSTLPSTECSNTTANFFGGTQIDECSHAVGGLLMDNETALISIVNGDCPTQFLNYVTTCNDVFDNDELLQLASSTVVISQATASNGRSCSELFPVLLMDDDDDELNCSTDYLLRQCSSGCRQILMNVTAEYGCCFNTLIAEFSGRSTEVSEQIEYAILTRDIYDLCDIESGGFCDGTTPPSYSYDAEQCVRAGDSFFADDTCLDYYRALGQRSSPVEVNNATTAICASDVCMNRFTSYINYLLFCRVGSVEDDDDDDDNDDDDDDDKEDTRYLDLAYLTGTTTCRVDSNASSCYSSIFFNPQYDMVYAAFDENDGGGMCASVFAEGTCSPECNQLLTTVRNSVGCCLGEYGRALIGADGIENVSRICNIPQLTTRCSGESFPISNSPCGYAYIELFTPNDNCSDAVVKFFSGDHSEFASLFYGDCPARFHYYATACSNEDDNDGIAELLEFAESIFTISQATSSNGRSCTDLVSLLLATDNDDDDDDEVNCSIEYLFRQCSDNCKQRFELISEQYGCCFNTFYAEFNGRSNEVYDQIESAILTRDIYSLCELQSPGFCTGTNPPEYTNNAEQCIRAGNSFFANDTCLDYYRTLGLRSSPAAVNDASIAICASQKCRNRMNSYIDYLLTCQVGSIYDDDDDYGDNDDDDMEDERYLEFANIIGNTTCRMDSDKNSCYSSIVSNPLYDTVSAAFDDSNPAAVCASVMSNQSTCSQQCAQLLTQASNSLGCCFVEYARAVSGDDGVKTVSDLCKVQLDIRCSEIQAVDGGSGGSGGANTQKGLGVLILLLLGMTAIVFS